MLKEIKDVGVENVELIKNKIDEIIKPRINTPILKLYKGKLFGCDITIAKVDKKKLAICGAILGGSAILCGILGICCKK